MKTVERFIIYPLFFISLAMFLWVKGPIEIRWFNPAFVAISGVIVGALLNYLLLERRERKRIEQTKAAVAQGLLTEMDYLGKTELNDLNGEIEENLEKHEANRLELQSGPTLSQGYFPFFEKNIDKIPLFDGSCRETVIKHYMKVRGLSINLQEYNQVTSNHYDMVKLGVCGGASGARIVALQKMQKRLLDTMKTKLADIDTNMTPLKDLLQKEINHGI